MDSLNNIAAELMNSDRHRQAMPILEKHLSEEPDDPIALANLSVCHGALGDSEKALSLAKTALELSPESGPAHYAYGSYHSKAGDFRSAEASYKKAKELWPSALTFAAYGEMLYARRAFFLAAKAAKHGLELEPDDPDCMALYVASLYAQDPGEASVAGLLESALSANPENLAVLCTAGDLCLLKEPDRAGSLFRAALVLAPEDEPAAEGLWISQIRTKPIRWAMLAVWRAWLLPSAAAFMFLSQAALLGLVGLKLAGNELWARILLSLFMPVAAVVLVSFATPPFAPFSWALRGHSTRSSMARGYAATFLALVGFFAALNADAHLALICLLTCALLGGWKFLYPAERPLAFIGNCLFFVSLGYGYFSNLDKADVFLLAFLGGLALWIFYRVAERRRHKESL